MNTQTLIILGAATFGVLGMLHLFYTLFTRKFSVRDAATEAAMKVTHPRPTSRTTMWDAWVGFNASHSLGAIAFSAVYLVLATAHMAMLRESAALLGLAVVTSLAYLVLAVRYWFRTPLIGILFGALCFLGAAFAAAA